MSKSIAIIGASGAIGQALVNYYANVSEDNQIMAITRTPQTFPQTNVENQNINFADETSIANVATRAKWDIVFVAIGILSDDVATEPEKSFKSLTATKMLHLYEVNTVYPALIAKYFLPQLSKTQHSIFAVLSARVGSIGDNHLGGWHSYRCSKSALNMLVKNFSIEMQWINKNAIIIGLHPGTVDSKLSQRFQQNVPAEKLFSPEFSAACLAKVLHNISPADSGHCLDWQGLVIEP